MSSAMTSKGVTATVTVRGFEAKVKLAPGLVVTLRGIAGKTREQLVAEAWQTVEWSKSQ